ncbi:MAG: glycosyltransferase family 2 protein [Muribaculaceae bacterium]|nr:glycosyltransferase family 2 protein [Muribaculaceae bacterium]
MKEPLSIVIPVKNRPELIVRCLDSVRSQSYRPIRIIVVDNASTDNTREAVEMWREKNSTPELSLLLLSEEKPGAAAARNRGLEAVDTTRMMFFDSDDRMLPELAVTVMEEFDRHPNLDLIYWRTAIINEREEVIPRRFARMDLIKRHIYNAILPTVSYALRTDFIRRIGGWDDSLRVWDDWELGLRLLTARPNMKGIFRTLVHIYPQRESITGTDFHSHAGEWEKAIEKMEAHASTLSDPLRTRILRMLLYRRVNLSAIYTFEGHPELATPTLKFLNNPLQITPEFSTLNSPHPSDSSQSEFSTFNFQLSIFNSLPSWRKKLLRLLYTYTSRGGRAAYLLWY